MAEATEFKGIGAEWDPDWFLTEEQKELRKAHRAVQQHAASQRHRIRSDL
jgi:hypothetical protein